MFDKEQTVQHFLEQKKEITDLGASISKEFIETQVDTIYLKSDFGVGSTFSFALQ